MFSKTNLSANINRLKFLGYKPKISYKMITLTRSKSFKPNIIITK